MKIIQYHIDNLNKFDEITKFRLIITGLTNVLFTFLYPILAGYYNLLEIKVGDVLFVSATIIAMFSILKTLGMKFVKYISDKISFSNIFLICIIMDILLGIEITLYFVSIKLTIWVEMILSVMQIPFTIAYNNSLNNYINYFYKSSLTNYQNYRTDLSAESSLLGLVLASITTLFSIKLAIIIFIVGILLLSMYQLKYYKVFKKYDFKYMLRYHKAKREV